MSDRIKEILEQIKTTDIEEMRVENGEFKLSLKRELSVVSGNESENAVPETETDSQKTSAPLKKKVPIKSSMVGTFFNSPAPDRPPFIINGNNVVYGQKVGVVEALKIQKDVLSSVKGVVVEVLVENNTPVEYGQELYLVEIE